MPALVAAQVSVSGAGFLGFVLATAFAVLHIGLAVVTFQDHERLSRDRRWRRRMFGPGWLWTLAVLLSGVAGMAAYWAIHRSNLGPTPEGERTDPSLTT